MTGITLGGAKAWRVERGTGGLVRSFQWLNGEPCLFVYPDQTRNIGALAIPLSSAHLWANPDGYPNLEHAIKTAYEAAPNLGLTPTRGTIHAIVDTVLDGIPTLIGMPPEMRLDERPSPVVGEMVVRANGKETAARDITADNLLTGSLH